MDTIGQEHAFLKAAAIGSRAAGSGIYVTASASACACLLLSYLVHCCTPLLWPRYHRLSAKNKFDWCNRIVSAAHAAVLVWNELPSLSDPALLADPLYAVNDRHFFWASVVLGYLFCDMFLTVYTHGLAEHASMVLHHVLGLACCFVGLYARRMAFYGAAMLVFYEATTPLLHVLGCLKLMGAGKSRLYAVTGVLFAAQFFVCRVLIANWLLWHMIKAVVQREPHPLWAWVGVALCGSLCALNAYWCARIWAMLWRQLPGAKPADRIRTPDSFHSPHIGQLLAMRAAAKRRAEKLRLMHASDERSAASSKNSDKISAFRGL